MSVADVLAVPFRGQFDLIAGRFILNYFVGLADLFEGLKSFVSPGGELAFVEWNYESTIAAAAERTGTQQLCHEWIMSVLASRSVELRAERAIPAAMRKAGLKPRVFHHRLRFPPTAAASIASYIVETMMALHNATGIALPIDDVTSFQAELGGSLGKLRVIELSPLLGIAAYVN